MSVQCGNPTFADDISLLALTPLHLQRMIDIVLKYCHHWNVSINVDKSSSTVSTKSRSKPVVDNRFGFGDRFIKQTESFVHLGILYLFHLLKNKDKIGQRLQ